MVRARHHPRLDRARARDGAVGQRPHRRPRRRAHGLFRAHRAADDRGREHLAVFLHAAVRPARAGARALRRARPQLARHALDRARLRHRGGGVEGGGVLHDLLSRGAPADSAGARRGGGARRRLAPDLLPPRAVSPADAHDLVRADQRGDQRVPHRRPHHRDDARRPRQCHHLAALLCLSGRLHLLGFDLRRDPDHGAARRSRGGRARSIRFPRTLGALPISGHYATRGTGLALETAGAWLLALLWILPLAYAVWTAFHPAEFSARFDPLAPLPRETPPTAWRAAPFARYFVNTFLLVTLVLACQLVLCTLAAYAFARFSFAGREIAFALVLLQLMIMPDVLIVENYRTMGH